MFQRILDNYWEDIACLAYEGYQTSGKGGVFLDSDGEDPTDEHISIGYAVYDHNAGKPDTNTARRITEYDPKWEVIFQYMRPDGSIHTLRLKTAPAARHPWRIWFFRKSMRDDGWEDDE